MKIISPPMQQHWYERHWKCQACGVKVQWNRQDFNGGLVSPIYQKNQQGETYVSGCRVARCPGCHGQQVME